MQGFSTLGIIHTLISLVAVGTGFYAVIRYKQMDINSKLGRTYWVTTVLTCLTGFGIFHHGGFGKPHVLGIVTLLVLGLAYVARAYRLFGRYSEDVEQVSYSTTLLFHMIPAVTETSTRLPIGHPWVSSPDASVLQNIFTGFFILLTIGAVLQVRRLHALSRGEHALAEKSVASPTRLAE